MSQSSSRWRAKPTELRKAEGNRGGGRINEAEPTPEHLEDLAPPEELPRQAVPYWEELAPILSAMRILSEADRRQLMGLCVDMAHMRIVDDQIEADGPLLRRHFDFCPARKGGECGCTGPMVEHPAMRAKDKVWRRVHAAMCDFGMNPSMRAKVSQIKPKPAPQDESALRFFGPRNKA